MRHIKWTSLFLLQMGMTLGYLFVALPSFSQDDLQLLFSRPAAHFTASSPLGNGRLGAMVFGDPNRERIVLNEISMWSGGVQDPNRADAYQYLKPIQQLLLEGKNLQAQKILQENFVCAGKGTGNGSGGQEKYGCYQTLGDCWIAWADTSSVCTAYSRYLRLDSAISVTTWTRKDVVFRQQVIVSAPAQALVIRLTASRKGALQFSAGLSRKERAALVIHNNEVRMTGTLNGGGGEEGIRYAASMEVLPLDGRLVSTDKGLTVEDATECLIIITAATNMNWPHVEHRGPDPMIKTRQDGRLAAQTPWTSMLHRHVADFQSYFNRCSLQLEDSSKGLPLADRLGRLQNGGDDASLVSLYFNFGRYLLISSSRGSLPANLQGLWAEEYQTPWNGDYHTNINIQMNYWLTDEAGLPDCQLPVFRLIEQMARYGKATARAYYNAQGWVTHAITNPWGFTAPGEGAEWGSSLTGGAWLATHILTHYQFYPDKDFLRQYYPVLKGAAEFFQGILIREPRHNWLVTAPSNSPENSYRLPEGGTASTCMGPTMDMQIGRQLLLGTAGAARILGVDAAWADSLQSIAMQLAPDQISARTGGVQEWLEDYEEAEPQHRHVSPLYGLHPYDEITPWATPALAEAAKKTLIRRGDEGTGWSRAWKIAFWARLGDGSHAYKMLKALWKPAGKDPSGFAFSDAGTYPNLFDACPPFQIDGNFGAAAAIMEFFMQSHGDGEVIRLLPALPDAGIFRQGRILGIRARKGFEIDMRWKEKKITRLRILSHYGGSCRIGSQQVGSVKNAAGKPVPFSLEKDIVSFNTTKGSVYTISFTKD